MINSIALVLVLVWPLLLALALTYSKTRVAALTLTPWAAAPALLLALGFDVSTLKLPTVMLGGVLQLDATGRYFLLLAALTSIAAGLLARERFAESSVPYALFLLLAMSGVLGLALAGDALLLFTAATLLGYSLYALLALDSGPSTSARRVFVVFLVVSDLLVFELLLVLAHDAGGTGFAVIRPSLLLAEYPASTFALLLVGFGIKLGLVGAHLWLAPLFVAASAPLRAMVVSFVLCTGMLGWLRLLPLGEVHWPDAGSLLQWLALVTMAYAVVIGGLQAHFRAVQAYGVMALSALFLWLLGAVLREPTLWTELFNAMPRAMIQAGFSLAVLLLLPASFAGSIAAWFATLMLVSAPLGILATLAPIDPATTARLSWQGAALALLGARALHLQSPIPFTLIRGLVVGGISLVALLVVASSFLTLPLSELWLPALLSLFAAFAGWIGVEPLTKRLPVIPPGDLLGPIEQGVSVVFYALNRLGSEHLPRWCQGALALLRRLRDDIGWQDVAGRLEALFGRWRTAMVMLVMLGLVVALWGGVG